MTTTLQAATPSGNPIILQVEFQDRQGNRCSAIGGGNTVTDAISSARHGCPVNPIMQATRWEELYGE